MKGILKIFLLTCLVLVVACSSFVFAEESEPREPSFFISVNGKTAEENAALGYVDSKGNAHTQQVGVWGGFNGTVLEYKAGTAEDGVTTALHITGGSGGGGGLLSLNDGYMMYNNYTAYAKSFGASKNITHKDADGNVLAKTSGLIDASEIVLRVKSSASFRVKLIAEYRVKPTRELHSKAFTIPSTNGEWQDVVIPLSELEPDENGEWIYNLWGKYTSNFDPVVLMKFEGTNFGDTHYATIGEMRANWYLEDMISEAYIEGHKTSYFQNHDDFDYSAGKIVATRGNGTVEEYPLDHPFVTISGFNNKSIKTLSMTATVLNISFKFNVNIVEFLPPDLNEITVQSPKTQYHVNDPFYYDIGKIIAHYEDRTEEVALDDPNVKIEGFDSSAPAQDQVITVTYGGKTTTYTINVENFTIPNCTAIEISNPKKIYKVGEEFDWHTGEIVPIVSGFPYHQKYKLFNRYATMEGFDSSAATPEQEITFNFAGLTTTYTIKIVEEELPFAYSLERTLKPGNQPGSWGSWNGLNMRYEYGMAEDGVGTALHFTGGSSGGAQVALNAKDFGAGDVYHLDGTVTKGFIGADAIKIRYKSTKAISVRFRLEYRASGASTKSSNTVSLPSTDGEWKDIIIPFKSFEPGPSGATFEEQRQSVDWIYNIKGGYTTDFEPIVLLRFGASLGTDYYATIGNIKVLWHDDNIVDSISVEGVKLQYKKYEPFDKNTGYITANYTDGTSKMISLDNVEVLGFDTSEATTGHEITISYGGKTATYTIDVSDELFNPNPFYLTHRFENSEGTTIKDFDGKSDVIAKVMIGNPDPVVKQDSSVLMAVAYKIENQTQVVSSIKKIESQEIQQGITNLTAIFTEEELEDIDSIKILALKDEDSLQPIFSSASEIKRK